MSNEIVPVSDGSETQPAAFDIGSTGTPCRPHEFSVRNSIRGFDLLDFVRPESIGVNMDIIGENHHVRHFLSPGKGHKYINQFNPTPATVKPILDKIREASVLLLRGCDQLLLQSHHLRFEKFKSLTCLEISGISNLTTVPDAISEMSQLQGLNLSHLPIQQLPAHDFLSKLTNLRSLVLRGCYNFRSVPSFSHMPALRCLELSHLPIETFPLEEEFYHNIDELHWLILRHCSKLRSIPIPFRALEKLEVLDLSHCTTLENIGTFMQTQRADLQMLDLSFTALCIDDDHCFPPTPFPSHLTNLFARDIYAFSFYPYSYLVSLKMVDLSGVKNLEYIDVLKESPDLVYLDLSRTEIESVSFISELIHLRSLILSECTRLLNLPDMIRLTNLEVLDISGCEILADLPKDLKNLRSLKELNLSRCSALKELREGLFDDMSFLLKLDLSKTSLTHLPSIANLTHLQTLNLSQTLLVEEVPDLSNHVNLQKFMPPESDGIDFSGLCSSGMGELEEKLVSNLSEFHLASTFISDSGFDRFIYEFQKLDDLISNIEKNIKPTTFSSSMDFDANATTTAGATSQAFKRNFRNTHADLRYILKNIDHLESSNSCSSAEELLLELMDAATLLSADDFPLQSSNLNALLRLVAKLKLLILPPKQVDVKEEKEEEEEKKKKKKKRNQRFTKRKDEDEAVCMIENMSPEELQFYHTSYESLTDIQKNCLLYFAIFPNIQEEYMEVKESILLKLWYGEGFIDPILYANYTKNPQPTPNQNLSLLDPASSKNFNQEMCTGTETAGSFRNGANQFSRQVSNTKSMENKNTIEEIGREILGDLAGKSFVENSDLGTRSWRMYSAIHNFVKSKAKEEHFFNFDNNNGKLTPHITTSQRACLLKSQGNCPSSCKLWLDYTSSSIKLERFKTINTLLYVNEPIIDIKPEWFSYLGNLSVLHLASNLNFEKEEQIDIMDLKFLEELKNMKQLRLFTIEGFSGIQKLPDSICKATNLRMLNLTDCSSLEELPTGIGSLKYLTHLDLKNCHLLSMLPKGLSLLSKVQVLKGFVITYEAGGRQHANACTLRELLKMKSLRKLTLVVNRDKFPDNKDLQVFKKMKNLHNLKITWKKNYDKDEEPQDDVGQQVLWRSKWKQLKCWQRQTCQDDAEEEPLRSTHFDNLKKLVLCCFPSEVAPNWLHQGELQKLEKLYLVGGNLKALPRDPSQREWNVYILQLKYLSNLKASCKELGDIFPMVGQPLIRECPHIEIDEEVEYYSQFATAT